ncbi:MAG: hypothetical protein IKF14_11580 [Atopobiaceae bacterium]|nr:hypothetical protein [Atopobiaceae bacterium]
MPYGMHGAVGGWHASTRVREEAIAWGAYLDKRYRRRGWHKLPYGVYDAVEHEARFLDRRFFDLLMKCDAAPLTIMLDGAFAYAPGQDRWDIHYVRESALDLARERLDMLSEAELGHELVLIADALRCQMTASR